MVTPVAFIASLPGLAPILLRWLVGALVIVGIFLFNRSRTRAREQEQP